MKLVTFVHERQLRLGALLALAGHERVYDLNRLEPQLPDDIRAFLEADQAALILAQEALAAASPDQGLDPARVTIKAPIPRPGKIICIGQNYLAHAHESNAAAPPFPIIFAKYANTVIGHREPIVIPSSVQRPDYEGELAVVIGRRGRNIPASDALDYVAGYMPLNDVSARDWQNRTSQWVIGKTPDTFPRGSHRPWPKAGSRLLTHSPYDVGCRHANLKERRLSGNL
jgi:2-keto-4-pentenoate hydratase/2-oxohepta-3-ene-1,7-dioic acid hydratase in catechol pathway